ncbi:acyl-CoA dehydrogenase family protein [Solwaraspora sp. WMMD1047]|uniref:acyl-CoA dehydrogenase family protein n=1 Tax=Solwaraspora sp. WMMD1047 TaxID=3016102 RepID=UPI00241719E1|nr:acyl-CoA dehydrogenase family protein [Solwaraspora sp. WMMD1047]MDG4834374.1 acyl-CoA dehydrogenase family protein [Solwaraspora sp. WMMD1047]
MRWQFTAEQEALRGQIRDFLASGVPARDDRQYFLGRGGASREIYRAMGERGWLCLGWPVAFGGAGAGPSTEFVVWDELAYARAVRPDLAAGIVARTLITHGTPDQQDRFLARIARGEVGFALGYSEPEAGSDLAGVRTTATVTADGYRVTGEKRWTSDAHNSSYLWLLCRTGRSGRPGRDLTLLIVDLTAPGVTIRPIRTIDGHRLNEVFLDDVVVPVRDRVGPEGGAWRLIREALAVERHLMVLPGRVRRDYEDLLRWARRPDGPADAVARAAVLDAAVDLAEVEAAALTTVAAMERGGDGIVEAARAKLLASRAVQRMARIPFDAGDVTATDLAGDQAFLWHETVMETIAGGTSEVMLGMVARHGLGLGARS